MTTSYTHDGVDHQTTVQNYLATSVPENLQFLTINDTTFVSSRDTTNANTLIGTTGTTTDTPDPHFGFLELLRTENGRQYGINLHGTNVEQTTINRATRIKISSNTLDESDGTGSCPGIGTEVFSVDSGDKTNLIFRLTTLGQQGVSPNYTGSTGPQGNDYRCSYQPDVILLHGGEGWATGDTATVTMEGFDYTIRVEDHESTVINATINTNGDGVIRPEPTPFDADTAVTADTIIGGIIAALPSGINAKTYR